MSSVKGLDPVRSMLQRLSGALKPPSGVRVQLSPEAAAELRYLAAGGRDLLEATATLSGEVSRAISRGIDEVARGAPPATPWVQAGNAVLRRLRLRVAEGGADLELAPLKPSTVRRKGSARIAYETGALLRGLSSATVTVQRKT